MRVSAVAGTRILAFVAVSKACRLSFSPLEKHFYFFENWLYFFSQYVILALAYARK